MMCWVNKKRQLVLHEPSGLAFDEYVSCDANVNQCIWETKCSSGHHLICEGEEKQEEEVEEELIENRVSLFDAFQGLKAAIRYIQQFDVEDGILMVCGKLKNKLYTLKFQEICKQITILDWLKKWILFCFDFANDFYFMNFILNN